MCHTASPKWRPNAEIAWHHDRYPRHWSTKPARVISVKTTRLVCVLLRRTNERFCSWSRFETETEDNSEMAYWAAIEQYFNVVLFVVPESHTCLYFFVVDFEQVGYVRELNLVPGKVHKMRSLSLRPALFGMSMM